MITTKLNTILIKTTNFHLKLKEYSAKKPRPKQKGKVCFVYFKCLSLISLPLSFLLIANYH